MTKKKSLQGYQVAIDSFLSSSYQSDEEYGGWEEYWDNSLSGETLLVKENPDVVANFSAARGELLYVVWAEWSHGNSFGNAHNGGSEVFGIFRSKDAARELKEHLENLDYEEFISFSYNGPWTKDFKTSDDQVFQIPIMPPWVGYFENLEAVHIDSVVVR